MATLTVGAFTGAVPNRDVRVLPDNTAAVAINQRPGSGGLDPVRAPRLITAMLAGTKAVYRIPTGPIHDPAAGYWMQFPDRDTDVVRSPIVNDGFERYYWASPSTGLKYATKANILANGSGAGLNTGVQVPASPVTLDVIAGTGNIENGKNTAPRTTRSYVVTFVSAYGEEGAPSPPAEATGHTDQDWRLRDIPQPVTVAGNTDITIIRVYRTVTAASGLTSFMRVVDLAVGTLIYMDRASDLSLSLVLDSENANPPPAGMQGLALMPNGVMVGFIGNNIYFSENFKPHSWPAAFTLTVPHPIVGLGVYGTSCVICTQGQPCVVTGNSGATMSLSTDALAMPCLSRQSIVVAPEGVYWASSVGLCLYTPSGASIVSDDLIGRDKWVNEFFPQTIDAVLVYGAYTFLTGNRDGVGVERAYTFPGGSVVEYEGIAGATDRSQVGLDIWSGRPWVIKDGALYEWLPADTAPLTYRWRSKEFQTPQPLNMGAGILYADGATPIRVRVWANGKLIATRDAVPGKAFRLPSGFKADVWQMEFEGAARLHKATLATSMAELKGL